MNQIHFKNHKGEEFLFVKLPADAKKIKLEDVCTLGSILHYERSDGLANEIQVIGDENYKLISPLSEMTEEIWREIIPTELIGGIGGVGMQWLYPDYLKSNCYGFETATESGKSLMQSLGIYLVNPFGKHPDNWEYIDSAIHMYKTDVESWEKKEANTGNWIILKES